MGFDMIKTIQKVGLEAIDEHALQILFGKVESKEPLIIRIGDTWKLTSEFIVLDSPVEKDEDVIIIKYSTGNKYLVLATVEKVIKSSSNLGGIVNGSYSTSGKWKSLGMFTITHYCCEQYPHICNAGPPYKTATGTTPHVGGCAVDPKKIPLGSYIKINGTVYHAEDTGGAIKGNRIDVVTKTHKEALSKGTYKAEVFLKVGD
jgi:3D (Asp-Asp-Asp) domain-containing protein